MQKNREYKNAALDAMRGNRAQLVVLSIIMFALVYLMMSPSLVAFIRPDLIVKAGTGGMFCIMGISVLVTYFVYLPLSAGYMVTCQRLYSCGDNKVISNMFKATYSDFFRIVGAMLMMTIAIAVGFLLVVPGFIMIYGFSMTPYILEDEPQISAYQALKRSWHMMRGHKMDLFVLHLSFIGWGVLVVLTLGIASFWAMPYMSTAQAAFYRDLVK